MWLSVRVSNLGRAEFEYASYLHLICCFCNIYENINTIYPKQGI
jgi:hypothetical protein